MQLGRRRRLDRRIRERGVAPEPQHRERQQTSTRGPYDVQDQPEDSVPRIDLGSLLVPAAQGVELRLDVDKAGTIVAVTLRLAGSAMQLGAFAAPRNTGIWSEVRAEILQSLTGQGGAGTEVDGRFGPEIRALLATPQGPQPARFLGVDGPRWFVRALITGPAASPPAKGSAGAEPPTDAEAVAAKASARSLERVFAGIVVVRGAEPMAVREQLELRLPPDAAERTGAESDRPG